MPFSQHPHVISARRVYSVERIDGGDTIAVRVEGADGEEVAILAPIGPAAEIARRILEEAAKPSLRSGQYLSEIGA